MHGSNTMCYGTGLFTALQPRIIACRKTVAGMSMAVKFLLGPAVMAATSLAIGIRGKLLHVAVVQVTSEIMKQKSACFFGLDDQEQLNN